MVQEVIEIVFKDYNLHRIEAFVHPSNAPSIALLEALSFQKEGTAISAAMLNGQWQDMYRYALVNG